MKSLFKRAGDGFHAPFFVPSLGVGAQFGLRVLASGRPGPTSRGRAMLTHRYGSLYPKRGWAAMEKQASIGGEKWKKEERQGLSPDCGAGGKALEE
ncbi:hypothetical protein [uncultured Rikenella sp.]|uniref:hypothetical protein n=1 Tax=uncultured Rikenella sp. TaxID=368003 RepID=UPI002626CFCF|nr:hypothetical protein [uncultured Rikenella sp.]